MPGDVNINRPRAEATIIHDEIITEDPLMLEDLYTAAQELRHRGIIHFSTMAIDTPTAPIIKPVKQKKEPIRPNFSTPLPSISTQTLNQATYAPITVTSARGKVFNVAQWFTANYEYRNSEHFMWDDRVKLTYDAVRSTNNNRALIDKSDLAFADNPIVHQIYISLFSLNVRPLLKEFPTTAKFREYIKAKPAEFLKTCFGITFGNTPDAYKEWISYCEERGILYF